MTDTTTLIQRLREDLPKVNEPESQFSCVATPDIRQAADALEQQAAQIEAESHTVEPLRRLWPLIERSVKGYVFTSDKAGEVAADMAALRKAIES